MTRPWNPLMRAALENGDSSNLVLPDNLLDRYANKTTETGCTALHFAVSGGNPVFIEQLLGNDPSLVNRLNAYGESPLHWACKLGDRSMVSLLIGAGARVNQADTEGNTPLHWAAEYDESAIAEFLIAAGATLGSVNERGQTPLALAKEQEVSKDTLRVLGGSFKDT